MTKPASNLLGFDTHKNIKAYKHFYIPPKIISSKIHNIVVIMTKDNEQIAI